MTISNDVLRDMVKDRDNALKIKEATIAEQAATIAELRTALAVAEAPTPADDDDAEPPRCTMLGCFRYAAISDTEGLCPICFEECEEDARIDKEARAGVDEEPIRCGTFVSAAYETVDEDGTRIAHVASNEWIPQEVAIPTTITLGDGTVLDRVGAMADDGFADFAEREQCSMLECDRLAAAGDVEGLCDSCRKELDSYAPTYDGPRVVFGETLVFKTTDPNSGQAIQVEPPERDVGEAARQIVSFANWILENYGK